MTWSKPLQVCEHCGCVANAGNNGKWHKHGFCLLADDDAETKRSNTNSYLNKAAIYIDLTTEETVFARSFAEAGRFFGVKSSHIFGQVLRGNRHSHQNKLVLTLPDFLNISDSELQDLLIRARQGRRQGYRPPTKKPDQCAT